MTQLTGTLQDATSKVLNGSKGAWTKYEITVNGKSYQCKQDVWNHASALGIGSTIHAEVVSQQKGDFTNWYCNAVFAEHERGPANAQERNPDNPAARAMNAQASAQGLVTELMRHESIARMAAVKHLNEAQVPGIGTAGFLMAAKALADFYTTGKIEGASTPTSVNSENRDRIIPQSAVDAVYDAAIEDDSLPF